MANLETSADILRLVLKKAGELDDGTSDYQSIALSYINEVYQKVIAGSSEYNLDVGKAWSWAKAAQPLILTLQPFYSAGSVSMTNNSVNGVFSSPVASSQAGNWLMIDGVLEVFRIKTHLAGATAFTLDGVYTDATGSGLSFKSMQLDYALTAPEIAGIQRIAGPMQVHRPQSLDNDREGKIYGDDINNLRQEYPIERIVLGVPTRFAITTEADGVINVRFNKYVDIMTRVEVDYVPVIADLSDSPDSTPIIPRAHRDVLVYLPASMLCDDKNDDRADKYFQRGNSILSAMKIGDTRQVDETTRDSGRMIPRPDLLHKRNKLITY